MSFGKLLVLWQNDMTMKEVTHETGFHKSRRPTVAALEPILREEIKVLDHGFVRLIDYMGDDAAITQAARVSYGAGTKTVQDDRSLIRYLMRHRHSSPMEMCEIKVHVKLPIFVARQWVRHRTACLAGNVKLIFDLPGGIRRRGNQAYSLTVKEVFDRFQPTENVSRPERQLNPYFKRDRVRAMLLRSCHETDITPTHTSIVDIWKSGIKKIIRVDFGQGKILRATSDHLCFTDVGWMRLEEALSAGVLFSSSVNNYGYKSIDQTFSEEELLTEEWRAIPSFPKYDASNLGRIRSKVNTQNTPLIDPIIKKQTSTPAGYRIVSLSERSTSRVKLVHLLILEAFSNELRNDRETMHADHNRANNRLINLSYGTSLENASQRMEGGSNQRLKIGFIAPISWTNDGEEMTYDIEVSGQYHNFCAGGVYVHNSINEYSARYSMMEKEFYIPEAQHMGLQSGTNKQGRGEVLSGEDAEKVGGILEACADSCYNHYMHMLDDYGLARELARMNLTLNTYTQWYWKVNLHNLLNFLSLRADSHAQYEIRVYADVLLGILEKWVPLTAEAFKEYRLGAFTLSAGMLDVVRGLVNGSTVDRSQTKLSKREWDELMGVLGR